MSEATTETTWYVATNGSDSNDGRSWNSALLTLQAAITAANGFGDIYFGPGRFAWTDMVIIPEGVRLHGKSQKETILIGPYDTGP